MSYEADSTLLPPSDRGPSTTRRSLGTAPMITATGASGMVVSVQPRSTIPYPHTRTRAATRLTGTSTTRPAERAVNSSRRRADRTVKSRAAPPAMVSVAGRYRTATQVAAVDTRYICGPPGPNSRPGTILSPNRIAPTTSPPTDRGASRSQHTGGPAENSIENVNALQLQCAASSPSTRSTPANNPYRPHRNQP